MNNISNGKGGKPQLPLVRKDITELFALNVMIFTDTQCKCFFNFYFVCFRTIRLGPSEVTLNNREFRPSNSPHLTPVIRTTKQPLK